MSYYENLLGYKNTDGQVKMDDFVGFLQSLGADRRPHRGRTLLEHLNGTKTLLAEWGCSEHVCAAGLFHSIYGTPRYQHVSLSLLQRDSLRALIGEPAEQLVFLFSTCHRPQDLLSGALNWPNEVQFDMSNTERVVVNPRLFQDLVAIECANIVDQTADEKLHHKFISYLSVILTVMSASFGQSVKSTIEYRLRLAQ